MRNHAAVTVVALAIVSCSGDTAPDPGRASDEAPVAETPDAAADRVDTVRVTLDEYTIGIPAVLPAGPNVLRLESQGFEEHNLLFVLKELDSLIWETERRLSPYETRVVIVDLVPGAYTVVCDFSGHEDRGMFTDLLVVPDSAMSGFRIDSS